MDSYYFDDPNPIFSWPSDEEFQDWMEIPTIGYQQLYTQPSSSAGFSTPSSYEPQEFSGDNRLQCATAATDDYLHSSTDDSTPASAPTQPGSSAEPSRTAKGFPCTQPHCTCGGGKVFKRRSDLKKHTDKLTRPYACPEHRCDRNFANSHDLGRHKREVHGDKALKIPCPIPTCKRHRRGFGRKDNLAQHMRNMHSPAETAQHALAEHQAAAAVGDMLVSSPAVSSFAAGQLSPDSSSPAANVGLDAPLFLPPQQSTGASQLLLMGMHSELQGYREQLAARLRAIDTKLDAVQHTLGVFGQDAF